MGTRVKVKLRRWYYHKTKYINGGRGVISLFLAILMVPFLTIAGSLVNAARVDSAVAIFDEALCNASNSTLGTYDEFLRKRFGLLAMQQRVNGNITQENVQDLLADTFEYYMKENVQVLSNTYTSYESEVTGVYPLADEDVLSYQILEYSKYSVPTKLLEDSISLDALLKSFKESVFYQTTSGGLKIFTSATGVVDASVVLGQKIEAMKTELGTYSELLSAYNTKYSEFEGAITAYMTEKAAMTAALTALDPLSEDYETEYARIEGEYTTSLEGLKGKVTAAKNAYSTAIGDLSNEMPKLEKALAELQKSITDLGQQTGALATTGVATYTSVNKAEIDKKIKNLEEDKKANPNDTVAQQQYDAQIKALKEQKDDFSNAGEATKALDTAFKNGMSEMKRSISEYDATLYSIAMKNLNDLQGVVNAYDESNISESLNKATYYCDLVGLLTLAELNEAEKSLLGEVVNASIISMIQTAISFFEALFKIQIVNPKLNAVIDTGYYSKGLPSERDRTQYSITNPFKTEDQSKSQSYKELIGDDYGMADKVAEQSLDFFQCLSTITTEFVYLQSKLSPLGVATIFLDFANGLKNIMNSIDTIVTTIESMVNYFNYMFTSHGIEKKTLLTGYANYMFSNRVNYASGKALTGQSYTLRGQASSTEYVPTDLTGLSAILATLTKSVSGGTEKCFVGAEMEYLIFGHKAEMSNQLGTFLMIYGMRFMCNIPIAFDKEVTAIASAATVASWIVWIVYLIVEPLIDTIIIVNGGSVPIVKLSAYMTPTGLDDMLKEMIKLGVAREEVKSEIQKMNQSFTDAKVSSSGGGGSGSLDLTKPGDGTDTGKKGLDGKKIAGLIQMDYQNTLFLVLMFIPSDKILKRMADIIEMEAVENSTHSVSATGGGFCLDYSYTYLRVKSSFTMNEFIPLSKSTDGLKSKERIIYRGY